MKRILVILTSAVTLSVNAQQNEIYAKNGIAINGYDAVAYFTELKPVKGNDSFVVEWKNIKWLFATKSNADLFKATPENYEPQYGGYCAYGCSRGYKAKTSPDAWTIKNGKLYLNYDTSVRAHWDRDRQSYIQKADSNWSKVKESRYP